MVVIASRFHGPPDSGNGGYSCGLVGELVGVPAEVTLRSPPPLDEPLAVDAGDAVRLMRGSEVIAEGRPTSVELDVPEPPSFEEATERVARYVGFQGHVFPTCFVCGPDRAEGDGLRIFPGRNEADAFVAAPWIPHAADGNASGLVRPAILWAALDCPGYFGAAAGEMALLGRMAADVRSDVSVNTRCIVLGWKLGVEGRKIFAATALFSEGGELLGKARQTWIVLSG